MTYPERLRYLNLYSLKGRRIRGDLIETYKLYNNLINLTWTNFFTNTEYNMTRNCHGKIFQHHFNTNLRRNCYSNRVITLWNNLDYKLKTVSNVNSFKNHLDMSENFAKLFMEYDE